MRTMPFRRNARPVIDSVKHQVETSGIIAALTNTVIEDITDGVPAYSLGTTNGCPTGSKVFSFFHSMFIFSEGGELASEVPLVNWYIIHNPGHAWGTTFDASNLPTPGAIGIHKNKRHVIHSEQGLTGGGELSLAGVPMVFKGVIRIPKKMQRIGEDDALTLCIRSNFAVKFCVQSIYKHYK